MRFFRRTFSLTSSDPSIDTENPSGTDGPIDCATDCFPNRRLPLLIRFSMWVVVCRFIIRLAITGIKEKKRSVNKLVTIMTIGKE